MTRTLLVLVIAAGALSMVQTGCSPTRRTTTARANLANSGPTALRGTVGREGVLRNADPVYVSGYGLVVGLNNTGAREVPEAVAATMQREIETLSGGAELGGFEHTVFDGLTPREILRHPTTAVVLVEGAVPPGGPTGMKFDVRVRTLAGSSATSLEGGKLWTTRLQIGSPVMLGGAQTEVLAEARGEVFINPFADPGDAATDGRVGRVLGGGIMLDPQPLELVLENPLHSRANSMTRAINQSFPDGPRGPGTTAIGRNDQIIQVHAPTRYQQRFDDFVNLLIATPINQDAPELLARRYRQALVSQPELAEELTWALRALGESARGHVRDLYDFPEVAPRMAALTVGAYLNDPRASDFLERIAIEGDVRERLAALELLGATEGRPASDEVLRQVAGYGETLTLRAMAYDALMRRAERWQLSALVAQERSRVGGYRPPTESQLRLAAASRIPKGNPQGVERINVGGRFWLDILPFGEPMVYITLQGQPRIALFGAQAELSRPMTVMAWDNRLLMRADEPRGEVFLRYEDDARSRVVQQRVSPDLVDLVLFMARGGSASDFGQGLGFSYSKIVGAMAAIEEDGATEAVFATENDRLLAMLSLAQDRVVTDRPALLNDDGIEVDLRVQDPIEGREDEPRRTGYVVPIERERAKGG